MRTSPRRVTAAAVLLATALGGTLSSVSIADAAPDRGDGGVARAADNYGVSEAGLRARLRNDPNFRITTSGVAYNIDPIPTSKAEPARVIGQAFPLPDTFLLHSKPDSSKTIYLDFNGHSLSGTLWNTDFDGPGNPGTPVPNGSHPAMDLAGNGASFTDAELLQVQDIYQRVAEDYAPFDVDVTTEEPPAADIERANAGDNVYGTRALISPSATALNNICQGACGGVAFIGAFDHHTGKDGFVETHSQLQPAWVFPQALGDDVKNIAEATTHEVGHNFGLDHDGTNSLGYYTGHDSWAPIMGVAYDRPIGQFALNDYPDANLGGPGPGSAQPNADDLATINSHGGANRTDEAGTSTGNAGAVPAAGAYIHNRNDVDYFNLGTCSGNVTVTANNALVSPNLDIELQLINSGGTAVDTDNPLSAFSTRDIATGMDATASGTSLPSGTYYARVDGVGRGNATTSYTDYGSIGAYTLQVAGCGGGPTVEPPSAPQNLAGQDIGGGSVMLSWSAPADNGGGAITGYRVYVDGNAIGDVGGSSTGATVNNVPTGTHEFGVAAINSAGPGAVAEVTVNVSDGPDEAKPGKPRIGKATAGRRGGAKTAKIAWRPPAAAANPAINGYQIIAYRLNNRGKYAKISTSPLQRSGVRSITFTSSSSAKLKFAVKARNALGFGALSAKSNAVRPR